MKAAQLTAYGGQNALQVTETAPRPTIKPEQVLVDVYAAAVNPFDYKVREGQVRQMTELAFPATLGGDVAGVVAEIGSQVRGFEIGQAVYGQANALSGQGSFAEFTPVKAVSLASKPAHVDFAQAAALPLTGVSAYQALVDHIGLRPGQKILIHGGAGGIGSMAIQLAKHLGAYIATTAAEGEIGFVKELGADEIIDYRHQDFADLLDQYDAVYDTVGGETNQKSYGVLKPGGVLVSMVAPPDEALTERHHVRYIYQSTQVTTGRLQKMAELVDTGTLKVHIDKIFPLDQAAEAVEYLKTGHPKGKVVLKVKDQL